MLAQLFENYGQITSSQIATKLFVALNQVRSSHAKVSSGQFVLGQVDSGKKENLDTTGTSHPIYIPEKRAIMGWESLRGFGTQI